jgi:ATP-dependent Clp protease ATP-binding subunit ClpX
MDEIAFSITHSALETIVDKAIEYKLGARGLRSLCEAVLTDAMFELPGTDQTQLKVDKNYVLSKLNKSKLNQLKAVS